MLVVGGVVLALVLLTPSSRRAVKASVPRVPKKTSALPVTPDPLVPPQKPKDPTGPKLQVYKDGPDTRPIVGLYGQRRDLQAETVMKSIWQTGLNLSNLKSVQDWKNQLAKFVSPNMQYKMALAFIAQCEKERYPLDLAIGHAFAESGCRPAMTPNSAGAVGPLQVTPIAAQQVGEHWPPLSYEDAIRIGLKYMKWIRRTYPEAQKSVVECLRIYGMGYGGYQQAMKQGCPGKAYERFSVWQSECGRKSYIYTKRVMQVAKNCPELHTMAWDKWTGKE